MKTASCRVEFATRGNGDAHDITARIEELIQAQQMQDGTVTLWCVGSTGALTTIEFEPGCVQDFQDLFERIAPENIPYKHHERWHDDNGRSHVRASLLGPSLTIPVQESKLTLGTWQQIIFVDFDTRPRDRTVTVQLIGEFSGS